MSKHRGQPEDTGPMGPGPHPTAAETANLAASFDAQFAEAQDRNQSPPLPDTDDMRGGNYKL